MSKTRIVNGTHAYVINGSYPRHLALPKSKLYGEGNSKNDFARSGVLK
jgi:hypothetical protein